MTKKMALHEGFLQSLMNFPDRPAVFVAGETLTYAQLYRLAASLSAMIASQKVVAEPLLTAVFAYRSITAFAGILGALMCGHGYVPLNRTFPPDRTIKMLCRSGCRTMIVDSQSEKQLSHVLSAVDYEMLVILPERVDTQDLKASWPKHRFIGSQEIFFRDRFSPVIASPNAAAYVMFTSGSTGIPKGVVVTHANVCHYIDCINNRFSITHDDRFSQMFDMTFDLSVADIFVAWSKGACVCCPSAKNLINPGRFINESGLTVWFSVPSVPIFMKRLGSLKPGSFPNLRISMFCGEAMPVEIAKAWADAARNSIVENLYGPTELTIACMHYKWDPAFSSSQAELGVVPIGYPFPNMTPLVVNESLEEVAEGETGELLMTGPQISAGYWKEPEKSSAAFLVPPKKQELYYRTGDRVRKPANGGPMTYLGRIDNQVKILGHRVELAEIEAVIREESGIDGVVAVAWPLTQSGANGIEVFLQDLGSNEIDLKERIALRVPNYMVPKRFHFFSRLPINSNGKYDRKALTEYLEVSKWVYQVQRR
jgi:amino acid adenylation domain-containing protein